MSKIKHIFAIMTALGLLFTVLILLVEAEKKVQRENENYKINPSDTLKITTVIDVSPTDAHAIVQSFGEVKPRWRTVVKARKQGEVLSISEHLLEGKQVRKGEVLFTFDNRHYQTLLAESQHQMAQAELLLHTEKQQAKLAKNDWKLTRRKGNPSAFALRIPQIKAAQAQLKLAKVRHHEILQTGGYATIIAPYNGIVTSRSINLGEVVEAGQMLAELISSDSLDIKLRLDDKQWQLLGKKWRGQKVAIYPANEQENTNNSPAQQWSALIERKGEIVDNKTRLRSLHLTINSQDKPLAGSFVRVEIRGKRLSNLLKIPASALTPDDRVWFVDSKNKLHHFQAEALFSEQQELFVNVPFNALVNTQKTAIPPSSEQKTINSYAIVIYPLSSYLSGLEVKPRRLPHPTKPTPIKVTEQ